MTDTSRDPGASLITITHVTYGLHAFGLVAGALSATATVVGWFLFSWTSIIAVIINYIKRGEAQGTWLESHFAWQIKTFWLALGWSLAIALVGLVLTIILVGFVIWWIGYLVLGIWVIYRIAKGWLRLQARGAVQ